MPNINLSTDPSVGRGESAKMGMNWSLIGLFIILILTSAAWFALDYYNGKLDQAIASRQAQYANLQKELSGNKAADVLDFKNRLELAGELEKGVINTFEQMIQFEKVMVEGVNIDSYSYNEEKGEVLLVLLADDYARFARQILSMKQLGYFADVTAGKSGFSENDSKFSLELSLKLK